MYIEETYFSAPLTLLYLFLYTESRKMDENLQNPKKIDVQLHIVASEELQKAIAEELKVEDDERKDIEDDTESL